MRFESFDGTTLAYESDGDGTPVILLHGFAADSFINWERSGVVRALTGAGFRSVTLDQRGHGGSEKPHDPEAYADDAMVADAKALMDHLGLDSCAFVGYSMGAGVTLRLAAGGDERVKAAVLGGIGGSILGPRDRGGLADALLAEDAKSVTNPVAKSFRDFADLTGADKEALAALSRHAMPAATGVDGVSIPVLVLCGDNDPLVGDPQALADAIPGAKAAVVGGTHLNVVNNPDFHKEMLGFLEEHKGAL